jgi:hypothetical protein
LDPERALLRHFLAGLAYRTSKAFRDAPRSFADFRTERQVRTPIQILRHMTSVLGYARTRFTGGSYRPEPLPTLADELERFHGVLADLSRHLADDSPPADTTPERLLQGPFSDAMTHAGQIAMLRRLAGSPVPPEDFLEADISAENLGPDQPDAVSPDREWPEAPDGWRPPTGESARPEGGGA